MERLFGETLVQRLCTTGPLLLEVALDLMLQVLSALDAAHAENVIHRDIKPSNVFITGRAGMPPIAKVLDFGYARKVDVQDSRRLTRPGVVVGTPYYVAPEVLSGKDATHLSDIFACGAVLFELLTGKLPYRGSSLPDYVLSMRRGNRRHLVDSLQDAPAALSKLLDRTLSRNPSRRPQSARELHAELCRVRAVCQEPSDDTPRLRQVTDVRSPPPILWEDESSTSVSRRMP
jgi:serine/threonine-protein kinase